MEKDVDRIPKNADTDIIIRVDDFGGKRGVTIREFVRGERYTGFTKAGTRIPAEHFKVFKAAINSIDENEIMEGLGEGSNVEVGDSSEIDVNKGEGTSEVEGGGSEVVKEDSRKGENASDVGEAAI